MDKHGVLGLSWFSLPKLNAGAGHGLGGCTALPKVNPVVFWVVVGTKLIPGLNGDMNEENGASVDGLAGAFKPLKNPVALVDDISCWTSIS
jgi:hypothetical protein